MQKKIVVHMYLKNGKAVTGFDGKELLEDGDVMSIAQHYSNNGADELLIFDLSDDDADHEQSSQSDPPDQPGDRYPDEWWRPY